MSASNAPSGLPSPVRDFASAELFENAFNNAPIGMALVRLDGQFLKINPAFCRLVDYSPSEMLALDFQTITHAEDLNTDLDLLHRLLAGEISNYEMDKRYIRANGSVVWVHLSVSLVKAPDGSPLHFISQVQDLSARRDAEARYRLLAENITDMISLWSFDGPYLYVSPSAERVLGYTAEEMVGAPVEQIFGSDDLSSLHAMQKDLQARPMGSSTQRLLRLRRKDGVAVWLEINARSAQDDNGASVIVATTRDVSYRIDAQAALERKSRDLEKAGKAALSAMADAKAAAAAKSEFLANMSHEIRTPLTAVVGFTDLLLSRDIPDAVSKSHVDRVASASRTLLSIVNDVLDFSKLEAGQVEIVPRACGPVDLARTAVQMFEAQAEAKGLVLELEAGPDVPAFVAVDPDRLRQIIVNLVGNALKFTERGGVALRLRYDAIEERLHMTVQDTGPGLTLDQQERLFQRFSQVDGSSTRGHGGTGLGLAICKGLADAMGGGISLKSRRGRGSTFHVHVKAARTAEPPLAAAADEPALGIEGVRVLVVDDNAANRELARTVLQAVGVVVEEAEGGEEAVRAAMTAPYDIILMDIRMPQVDGYAALQRIRSGSGPNQEIPILAFSADTKLLRAPTSGHSFDDVVRKPLNTSALVDSIVRWTHFGLPRGRPVRIPATR